MIRMSDGRRASFIIRVGQRVAMGAKEEALCRGDGAARTGRRPGTRVLRGDFRSKTTVAITRWP
jgi:hypothetical protein